MDYRHGDLHGGNILFDPETNTVTLLDAGFMPDGTHSASIEIVKASHAYSDVAETVIQQLPSPVGALDGDQSSFTLSNPVAGERTAITLVLQPTMDVLKYETFVFTLGGWKAQSVSESSFELSGTHAASFKASWDAETSELTLTAQVRCGTEMLSLAPPFLLTRSRLIVG